MRLERIECLAAPRRQQLQHLDRPVGGRPESKFFRSVSGGDGDRSRELQVVEAYGHLDAGDIPGMQKRGVGA